MTKRPLGIAASVLILPAPALIVFGLANRRRPVWGLGLITVTIAMLMSLATRWGARFLEGMRRSCSASGSTM